MPWTAIKHNHNKIYLHNNMAKKATMMSIHGDGISTDPIDVDTLQQESPLSIKIKSATIKDEFCNYTYDHRVSMGVTNKHSVKSQLKVHPDLKAAMEAFNGHLAVICEEVSPSEVRDISECIGTKQSITEKLNTFKVDSFQVVSDGVILIGEKLLTTGEAVKLQTPEVYFEGGYAFSQELYDAVLTAVAEVEAYHEGKEAPDPQMGIDFGTEENA